jgi:hypothetical protein
MSRQPLSVRRQLGFLQPVRSQMLQPAESLAGGQAFEPSAPFLRSEAGAYLPLSGYILGDLAGKSVPEGDFGGSHNRA